MHVTAFRIARVLGTSPQLWLNLQNAVTLHDARRKLRNWRPARIHVPPASDTLD